MSTAATRHAISAEFTPESLLDQKRKVEAFARAVNAFHRREKRIMLMWHDGATMREIAEKFCLSRSRVGQILDTLHRRLGHQKHGIVDAPDERVAVDWERCALSVAPTVKRYDFAVNRYWTCLRLEVWTKAEPYARACTRLSLEQLEKAADAYAMIKTGWASAVSELDGEIWWRSPVELEAAS